MMHDGTGPAEIDALFFACPCARCISIRTIPHPIITRDKRPREYYPDGANSLSEIAVLLSSIVRDVARIARIEAKRSTYRCVGGGARADLKSRRCSYARLDPVSSHVAYRAVS
jgi:hypothetical protein